MEIQEKRNEEKAENEGATLVEYALLVALIAVVCIVAIKTLSGKISASFSATGSALSGTTG